MGKIAQFLSRPDCAVIPQQHRAALSFPQPVWVPRAASGSLALEASSHTSAELSPPPPVTHPEVAASGQLSWVSWDPSVHGLVVRQLLPPHGTVLACLEEGGSQDSF